MHRVGYARVSTRDQDVEAQARALKEAGCFPILTEQLSGKSRSRPQLQAALAMLEPGDELVIWKLDRASRSLRDLLWLIEELERRGARFRSLTEGVETSTPAGRMVASVLGAFAQFEREMVAERTRLGLEEARRRGRRGGRPRSLTAVQERRAAERVLDDHETVRGVARDLSVSPQTVSRTVKTERSRRIQDSQA